MNELSKTWAIIGVEGASFLVLGLLALMMPALFSFGIVLTIGALLLVSGVIKLLRTLKLEVGEYFWASLLLSAIEIALALSILAYPGRGLAFLTALLIVYFIIAGIDKIILALNLKHHKGKLWILISGVLSLLFSFFLVYFWTGAVALTLGMLFGINMILFGLALVFAWGMARSL